MASTSPAPIIVLDTAALIAGTDNLFSLGGLINVDTGSSLYTPSSDELATFYTIPEVIQEVRDPRARARLALLRESIKLRAPSSEALAATIDFSKRTGDFAVLSLTDLKVIALTRMLERELNGDKYLNSAPSQRRVSEIRIGRAIPFEELDRIEAEELQKQGERQLQNKSEGPGESVEDEEWETVQYSRPETDKSRSRNPAKPSHEYISRFEKEIGEGVSNLDEHPVTGKSEEEDLPMAEKKSRVRACDGIGFRKSEHPTSEMKTEVLCTFETNKAKEDVKEQGKTPAKPSSGRRGRRRRHHKRRDVEPLEETTESSPDQAELIQKSDETDLHDMSLENMDLSVIEAIAVAEGSSEYITHRGISSDESDDTDEGECGWITESNLEEHLARDRGGAVISEEDRKRVACVTTDFAMQSTMLQMGLKLLSVDGRRAIRKIKHFALRCQSCGIVTTELERKFCSKCGNACMHRVAYRVGNNGTARAFLNPKKKPLLRGTKYPIPMPRGGRHNKDLILREDQIDPVKQRRLQKQRERLNVDVLDPTNFYNAGAKFNPHNKPMTIGYGRRNPNEVRGSSRGKR